MPSIIPQLFMLPRSNKIKLKNIKAPEIRGIRGNKKACVEFSLFLNLTIETIREIIIPITNIKAKMYAASSNSLYNPYPLSYLKERMV